MSGGAHDPRIGRVIAAKYRLDSVVGMGGMGTVFAATHTWTGRRVAVKLLNAELARDAGVVARFLQEARTAATLELINVVGVLDMGQDTDGSVYMVLELLVGQSLAAVLEERGGRLSVDETMSTLLPVIRALVSAHDRGIVHRDLKPDNIFISRNAEGQVVPKLLDFGIAKVLEQHNSLGTKTGNIIGTPHYMSPEQAIGATDVGPSSDVWSMGVVLYQCLSGALPFDGPNVTSVLLALTTKTAVPLSSRCPDLSPELGAAVDRALVSERAHRHRDAAALLDALQRVLGPRTGFDVPDARPSAPAVTATLARDSLPGSHADPSPAADTASASGDLLGGPLAEPPPAALIPSTPGAWATTGVPLGGGSRSSRSRGLVIAIAGVAALGLAGGIGGAIAVIGDGTGSDGGHTIVGPASGGSPLEPPAATSVDAGWAAPSLTAQRGWTADASPSAFADPPASPPRLRAEPAPTGDRRASPDRRRRSVDAPSAAPVQRPAVPGSRRRDPTPMLRTF